VGPFLRAALGAGREMPAGRDVCSTGHDTKLLQLHDQSNRWDHGVSHTRATAILLNEGHSDRYDPAPALSLAAEQSVWPSVVRARPRPRSPPPLG